MSVRQMILDSIVARIEQAAKEDKIRKLNEEAIRKQILNDIKEAKIELFYSTFQYQNWSIPNSLIYYISKNPSSSKAYEKMIQSCKYFFIKNPILIVADLTYCKKGTWCFEGYRNEKTDIQCDVKKCSSKIWVTQSFSVYDYYCNDYTPFEASAIIPKLYRCDADNVFFIDQQMSFSDYLFICKNVRSLTIDKNIVRYPDGKVVPLEKLIEVLPKLFDLNFADSPLVSSFTKKTIENLFKCPEFLRCSFCYFWDFTESFDIETLFKFAKTNTDAKYEVNYVGTISEAYEARLEEIKLADIVNIYLA